MATAEVEPASASQPLIWSHLSHWVRSIPRSVLLSMVGPSLLLILGYFGWRFVGAKPYDAAFYGIQKAKIEINPQPGWLKTSIVEQVYDDSDLGKLSVLDSQSPALIARAFDKHPAVKKTRRVEPMAGGRVVVSVEYRIPVAMVCLLPNDETAGGKPTWLPIDAESYILPTQGYFSEQDVKNYIWIFSKDVLAGVERKIGRFGDPGIEEAARLCALLAPIRDKVQIKSVYVEKAAITEKTSWALRIETQEPGPQIIWGSAPGLESVREMNWKQKYERLLDCASDRAMWAKRSIDLTK